MLTRLRSRGSTATTAARPDAEGADPADLAAAASSRRSVLGDVSNKRQSQKDGGAAGKGGGKKQAIAAAKKVKNPFTASSSSNGLIERENRAATATATASSTAAAVKEAKAGRSSRSRASSISSGAVAAGRRSTRKAATTTTTSTSTLTSNGGSKRSGAAVTAVEEAAERKPKRAKVADGSKSRARARAQDDRPAQKEKEAIVLSDDDESVEEVAPRDLSGDFIVPPDYRLERSSFDGKNHTEGIAPHDAVDKDSILQVAPYVTDLFQHLFQAEARSCPEMYMEQQADINAKMRAILVDWLVEVHMKFRLVPDTLYLCINLIDRYCSHVSVARSKLQLVGVTALLIACKYEEIYPPEVRDCVYITDRAYQRQEVLDMEQDMLQRLRFKITVPTGYPFLLRFLNVVKASSLARVAANYYMERTLQEHDLLRFKPSVVAASAVILALNNPDICEDSDCPGLPQILTEYTGFSRSEIMACSTLIATKVGEEPVTASRRQLVAVKRKYDHRKYQNVSMAVQQPKADNIMRAGDAGDCV